ncbi:MAG: NYN domain-containing protein [Candidatus Nanoarchaeia archaeon]
MRHEEQRVLVLFDVQNLYYSAKHLYNQKVNFRAILKEAVAGRKLVRAIAYVIKTDIKEESNFHEALNNAGIEVKSKDLQVFYGGAKKGDWDIGIAMDAIRMANKIDTFVIVSGDGDFKDLLDYMKSHGCRTEVVALGKTASKQLKEEADMFIDMEENINNFLIGNSKHNGNNKPTGKYKPQGKQTASKYSKKTTKKTTKKTKPDTSKSEDDNQLEMVKSNLSKQEGKSFEMPESEEKDDKGSIASRIKKLLGDE